MLLLCFTAQTCRSHHAYRRVSYVIAKALTAHTSVIAEGHEETSSEAGKNSIEGLCRCLCRSIGNSSLNSILDEIGSVVIEDLSSKENCVGSLRALVGPLLSVAREGAAAAKSGGADAGDVGPALSLLDSVLSTLIYGSSATSDEVGLWRNEMVDLFVKSTLTGGRFASGSDVSLFAIYLSSLSQAEFDDYVAPAIGLKLRASPDGALPTAEAILSALVGVGSAIDATGHIEGETKLLASGVRQIRSENHDIRLVASSFLVHLAMLSNGSIKAREPSCSVVKAISEALSGKNTSSALSQPGQRLYAYQALERIGMSYLSRMNGTGGPLADEEKEVLDGLVDNTLAVISQALSKETDDAVSSSGFAAFLTYTRLAKWLGSKSEGYNSALAYLVKPAMKNLSQADFRSRMGALFTASVLDDFIESIVLDLFQHEPKLESKLLSFIDIAMTKHSTAKSVLQIDGVIAIFLMVIKACSTSSKLPPSVAALLATGSSFKKNKVSFLYSDATNVALSSNVVVGSIVHQIIALYCKLAAKLIDEEGGQSLESLVRLSDKGVPSAAARTLAFCAANPTLCTGHASPGFQLTANIKKVLAYSRTGAKSSDAILVALFDNVNIVAEEYEASHAAVFESVQARDGRFDAVDDSNANFRVVKGKYSSNAAHRGFEPNTVRRVATMLASSAYEVDALCKAAVLTHAGTTMRTSGRRQRDGLVNSTVRLIREQIIPVYKERSNMLESLAEFVTRCSSSRISSERKESNSENNPMPEAVGIPSSNEGQVLSHVVHESALSLISTLGIIGGKFDPDFDDEGEVDNEPFAFARKICVDNISPRLASNLFATLKMVGALTSKDLGLYKSSAGVLYVDELTARTSHGEGASGRSGSANADRKRPVKGRKGKGDFGAGFEEEEWERQMKRELAAKKKAEEASLKGKKTAVSLTAEEKKLLVEQDEERNTLLNLLDGNFLRTLAAIHCLCSSEIEIGNACLPHLSSSVILSVVLECDAYACVQWLPNKTFETLCSLTGCVYEIDEIHAAKLARALAMSYEQKDLDLTLKALPSACPPAACVVFEIDDLGDCLSGASFLFLFPVIRAALMGPRTPIGCEGALRILYRHASMLAGNDMDPVVKPLRKEMASTVLELLSHDRSQKFIDPTPFQALICIYEADECASGPSLTAAELAPLLGEYGALGSKNCRIGSMLALATISSSHPRLVKKNPLIENRVWLNCFDENEKNQIEARKTWKVMNITKDDELSSLSPPSKMYAVALIPLLHHKDESIANASAAAFAHAMGMHISTIEKNCERICSIYVEAYPTQTDDQETSIISSSISQQGLPRAAPIAAKQPKKQKKVIDTGLPKKPKKKTPGGNLGKLTAGTGVKPKKRTGLVAGKGLSAKTKSKIPEVKERIIDRALLEDQFKTGSTNNTKVEKDTEDKISARLGILRAISCLCSPSAGVVLDTSTLRFVVGFLVAYGLADANEVVRNKARNASRDIVASHGSSEDAIALLLPNFEAVLKTGKPDEGSLGALDREKVPHNVSASDRRKEGIVVALGSVALHLKNDDIEGTIDETIDMLINALKTPSEDVQSSVALCLSKLMKKGKTQSRIDAILSELIKDCLGGDKLATRRGAAYGISAVVKGSGIATLKKYEVVKQLEDACSNGSSNEKEGALFAIELLSGRLALLFEPYVIVLLPSLLKSFSDSSDYVRDAASHTADLIMSKLSAHGVKMVMPAVLKAFDDPAWRTKQASIQMLGSMSHCAPKQLANCLPKVVPKLTEAFSDTHPKVKMSAEGALDEISKVIRNPEIASISSILLAALIDPATGTLKALETLIETEFLHAIDAPSLALIVPVLHRGLRDRTATTKRYGALIAGNICTMINDPRDFVPYLSTLLPDLKSVLLDPIPDVRSTSAKALGSLARALGEDTFPGLRPWFVETLQAEGGSSVERSGAAQGLTEVLIAGGAGLVENVMFEEILPLKSHPKSSTREGVLWVLTFLPSSLGQGFAPLIDASLPALISGLADESESVRDVALRAGRVMVRSQGKPHIDKILPSLENGLSDDDYRIRVASLTLLGDLLSMLGGTKVAKGDADTQDDIRAAERAQAQIALVLGAETRKRLLSRLYLARCDTASVVRQISLQVWKTVVSVTVRTLREILHVLVEHIVDALASGHPEQTEVAGRCLGDITQKLGDAVLPDIIPVLRDALYRGDRHTRRGVCVGLTDIIGSSSRDQIAKYLDILVKVVQDALCDEDDGVRSMAASCFQSLYTVVGSRALDEVVPTLLFAMESEDDDAKVRAVNGLVGILSIRSKELLPYLIPRLLTKPITKSHADALTSIASVTGATLHLHFSTIMPGLLTELACFFGETLDDDKKERERAIRACSRAICGSVEEIGINWLVAEIASKCSNDKVSLRKESCEMLQVLVEESEC